MTKPNNPGSNTPGSNASTPKTTIKYVLPLIIFIGLGGLFYLALGNDPKALESMTLNETIPEFSMASLDDPNVVLTQKDFKGPALINLWATWCPSCRIEHPVLNALAKAGVTIYGIDHVDQREAAKQYLKTHGNPYRLVVFDEKGGLGLDFGVTGAPETFLIDAQGVVRYHHVGVLDEKAWYEKFAALWQTIGGKVEMQPQAHSGDAP